MLHVKTLCDNAEEIVKEALVLRDIAEGNFCAKRFLITVKVLSLYEC